MSTYRRYDVNPKIYQCIFAASEAFTLANIQQKLNGLITSSDISTRMISEATGISVAAINNLRRGEGNPTVGTLVSIASFFNVSLSELLGFKDDHNLNQVIAISLYDLRKIHETNREELSRLLIEPPKNMNVYDLFAVTIDNNTLLPFYEKGTVFIACHNKPLIDGDLIIARLNNTHNIIKRCFIRGNSYILQDLPIEGTIEKTDINHITILGIVIQINQKIT